jgi:NDP-sugar pyrophosphorylase family protein
MKAIILCAGYGTRMKPYTNTHQKTMIPVHDKPLLEYIIDGIKNAGLNEFILVVGYKKEQIINYFGDGHSKGISIEYVEQKELDGTGGAVLLCEPLIEEDHFFLTWGDILVPYDFYKQVYKIYREENEDFILTTNYADNLTKGCAIHCNGNYCTKMIEKPKAGTQATNLNNCGIFILSTKIFDEIKKLEPSKRGELELPDALGNGIREQSWKVRVVKLGKGQFRGDFGDKSIYEKLNSTKNWLKRVLK